MENHGSEQKPFEEIGPPSRFLDLSISEALEHYRKAAIVPVSESMRRYRRRLLEESGKERVTIVCDVQEAHKASNRSLPMMSTKLTLSYLPLIPLSVFWAY